MWFTQSLLENGLTGVIPAKLATQKMKPLTVGCYMMKKHMFRPLATEKLANRSDTIYIVYYAHDTQS